MDLIDSGAKLQAPSGDVSILTPLVTGSSDTPLFHDLQDQVVVDAITLGPQEARSELPC